MTLLWIKGLHLFFMIAWMAGIFYLPRLFVYHAAATDTAVKEQLKIMERRLWYFVTPFATLTLIFGLVLIYMYGKAWFAAAHWLHLKLVLVSLLYVYHFYLYRIMKTFAKDQNTRSAKFYRFVNEGPVLVVLAIVLLAAVKHW